MILSTMSQYQDRFPGRPAAVLGGGPSLPADMARLPEGCLLIAVNYHAFHLCEPDFMVYNDRPEDHPYLSAAIFACAENAPHARVTRVSPDPTSDVLFDVDVWTGFYSSQTAAWFAMWMGCDPIILCGIDCYQGDKKYFHEYVDGPHLHYESDHYIRPWVEEARARLPHPKRVRAMSGPLINLFGQYQAGS
jgi:hypothetical protein